MPRRAFTLLEVLLVIALLGVLAAITVPSFSGQLARRQLVESAEQLRSLMFLTSAEARHAGRRFELRFVEPDEVVYLPDAEPGDTARAVEVRIERDPLTAPGRFEPLQADWARWTVSGHAVQVAAVEVVEPIQPLAESGAPQGSLDDRAPPSIIFGPDGRSQVGDATVTLVGDSLRGYVVRLRATTGLATIEAVEFNEAER